MPTCPTHGGICATAFACEFACALTPPPVIAAGPSIDDLPIVRVPSITIVPAQPVPESSTNPKDLLGAKKPPMWLNPRAALLWMAKAFEFGAYGLNALGERVREKGYGPYNWREKKVSATVYVAAAERHLAEYLDGDDLAADSKVKHLGHVMACCAIILDAEANGNLIDDRPPKGPAGRLIEFLTRKG